MPDCRDLLRRAKANPAGIRFSELCQLAECFGFVHRRTRGSHWIYVRPGWRYPISLQDDHGMAKPYQVRQLLATIEAIQASGEGAEE